MSDSDDDRKHALAVAIGEARGDWMASRRREAFRAHYGREPVFAGTATPGDDFAMACWAAGQTKTLYALFAYDVRDALAEVPRG